MPILFYLFVKALVYIGWCYVGVVWFRPAATARLPSAIALGLGRLALGICLGLFIFLAALSMNNSTRNELLTYLAIYVPVRVVEWLVWYLLVTRVPWSSRAWIWVLGGIVASCVADVPLAIVNGGLIPVGRPFC